MLKIILCSFLILSSASIFAVEGHGNGHKEEHGDEHGDEHKDEHKDEHEKVSTADGFKLNAAAMKTFELKTMKITSPQTKVSKNAIYKGLNEVNIYRFRAGLYKRIDFKTLSQDKNDYLVSSTDLKIGDEIVVSGIGFLRMAEIAASGGLSDSHSH